MSRSQQTQRQKGFTLMELMVSVTVFVVAILGTLMAYLSSLQLISDSEATAQAMADAKVVLEEIRSEIQDAATFAQIRARTAAGWTAWVRNLNLSNLNGELVRVLPGGVNDDPWPVTVQVQWLSGQDRARQANVHTVMTNRR